MMNDNISYGWIKLHRSFIQWEWFDTPNMITIFVYCLLKSNHKDNNWRGILIKRGTFITSTKTISNDTNISTQSVRTCLTRLEKSGEINKQTNKQNTLITVCKYDSYQDLENNGNKPTNKPPTNEQQTTNKRLTTNKNDNNYKELKEEKKKVFFDWIEYRKEINKPIKSERSINTLIKKFNSKSLAECVSTVNASIENNWQGLFWDKNKSSNKKIKPTF